MVAKSETFDDLFLSLTGHAPFPWQQALFAEFLQKQFRKTCDVPTGLGKTSIITIWLLALLHHARTNTPKDFPRRLIYVVNRRTVVDQATREAERMREELVVNAKLKIVADTLGSLAARASDAPLAISTLRGQFADNAEWRNDPARPSVIVGTVDMIGSRLLFAGYGCGFKSRPLHAGFLGQDALLVHDEAHLEPAFQELLAAIDSEQQRCRDFCRFRVMALTATSRSSSGSETPIFSDKDREHSEVSKRFNAKKWIALHPVEDERNIADEVVQRALIHKDSNQAILIFLRRLEHVEEVANKLRKAKLPVQRLTGTIRGLERDSMAMEDPIFARFMPKPDVTPQQGTVYLVCTSAGEVGVDISADHLVCDLTPFDSMAQRFGRVNRFGNGDARIDIAYATVAKDGQTADDGSANNEASKPKSKKRTQQQLQFDQACELTLSLLQRLPKREDRLHDASPAALNDLPVADRRRAFTPPPTVLPATDILFDAWALTSIRERLPGRPAVADWLHGVADWEPPETYIAWREEVDVVTGELFEVYKPDNLLDDYPLKPHELLRDNTGRIFGHLKALASQHAASPVWITANDGAVAVTTLAELVATGQDITNDRTVLLPPTVGGLGFTREGRSTGVLDGAARFDEARRDFYDVADKWVDGNNNPRRLRVWDDYDPPGSMRRVCTIDTRPDTDDEFDGEQTSVRRYWHWYVRPRSADDDGSRSARQSQELQPHLESAERFAQALVDKLRLAESEASAVKLAARWHDLGKHRAIWQRSIRNRDYPQRVLAKSGGRMQPIDLSNFRHEFGSLIDVSHCREFIELNPEAQDLVLHLIGAHHGRARPHFPADEAFDPEHAEEAAAEVAREVPRRFARLQRKYGRWGLSYLESLLRAADALASQVNGAREAEASDVAGPPPQDDGQ